MNPYGPINDSAFQKAGDVEPPVAKGLRLIDEHPAFQIAEDVYFTQADVCQIQLAKGAISNWALLRLGGV
jgi:uncharacterized 2Fe-2S/4Fe-4S cluster protein (DUF4445 family)